MAARRPVLVHAPPDAFVSKYFREHNCGLVVDRDDPKLLARQLGRLLDDPTLGSQLAENAWQRALVDFNLETAQRKFAQIMKLN